MADLTDFVTLSVVVNSAGISKASFGTPMLLSYNTSGWGGTRTRSYTSLPAVLADFARLLELGRKSNELDNDPRVIGKSRTWRRDAELKELRRELGYDEIAIELREKEVSIAKALYVKGEALYDAGSHW